MASNMIAKFTGLVVGVIGLTSATTLSIQAIRTANPTAAPAIFTSDQFFTTGDNSSPEIKIDDESVAALSFPTPDNQETCMGSSGALLCQKLVKLTGSGGSRRYNAGSFVCSSGTCAMVDIQVFVEANPLADRLFLGWTNTPLTQSGAQFINNGLAASGSLLVGSGSYIHPVTKVTVANGLVPVNATVKAVWKLGTASNVKAAALFRYYKYYTP